MSQQGPPCHIADGIDMLDSGPQLIVDLDETPGIGTDSGDIEPEVGGAGQL